MEEREAPKTIDSAQKFRWKDQRNNLLPLLQNHIEEEFL